MSISRWIYIRQYIYHHIPLYVRRQYEYTLVRFMFVGKETNFLTHASSHTTHEQIMTVTYKGQDEYSKFIAGNAWEGYDSYIFP